MEQSYNFNSLVQDSAARMHTLARLWQIHRFFAHSTTDRPGWAPVGLAGSRSRRGEVQFLMLDLRPATLGHGHSGHLALNLDPASKSDVRGLGGDLRPPRATVKLPNRSNEGAAEEIFSHDARFCVNISYITL